MSQKVAALQFPIPQATRTIKGCPFCHIVLYNIVCCVHGVLFGLYFFTLYTKVRGQKKHSIFCIQVWLMIMTEYFLYSWVSIHVLTTDTFHVFCHAFSLNNIPLHYYTIPNFEHSGAIYLCSKLCLSKQTLIRYFVLLVSPHFCFRELTVLAYFQALQRSLWCAL